MMLFNGWRLCPSGFSPGACFAFSPFPQVVEASDDVGVHKEEITGHEEQFVLDAPHAEQVAQTASQIEEGLQQPESGIKGWALCSKYQYDIDWQQGIQQGRAFGYHRKAQEIHIIFRQGIA